MDSRLIDLFEGLQGGADETTEATQAFFESAGFPTVIWAQVDRATRIPGAFVSNVSTDFLNQYMSQGYVEHDPWFRMMICGDMKFDYEFEDRNRIFPDRSAVVETLLGESRDIGLRASHFTGFQHGGTSATGFNLWSGNSLREIDAGLADWRPTFDIGAALADLAMSRLAGISLEDMYGVYPTPLRHTGETLSPREVEVLQFLASGLRNDRIGEKMGISLPTVRFHFQNIRRKLGAKTREQALALALKGQLLQL